MRVLVGDGGHPVTEQLTRVTAALRAHRGTTEPADDATVVALQVSHGPVPRLSA